MKRVVFAAVLLGSTLFMSCSDESYDVSPSEIRNTESGDDNSPISSNDPDD